MSGAGTDPWGVASDTAPSAPVDGWLPSEQQANEAIQGIAPGSVVTSEARTAEHNAAVGGVPDSMHVGGQAMDFVLPKGMTADQVKAQLTAQGYPVSEFLNEGDHIHWGWRPKGNVGPAPADPWGVQGSESDPWAPAQQAAAPVQQKPAPVQPAESSWADVLSKQVENTPARMKQMIAGLFQGMAETNPSLMPRGAAMMDTFTPPAPETKQDAADRAKVSQWAAGVYATAAQQIKENSPQLNDGSVKDVASKVLAGTIDMVPLLAATAVTRNPLVGAAMMGGQAAGESYGAARASGRTPDQARLDSLFTGTVNGALGSLPLGVLMKPGQTFLGKTLQSAGTFGAVSVMTEALQLGYDRGLVNPNMTLSEAWQRLKDAGITGTLQGALLGGGHAGLEKAISGLRAQTAPVEARQEPSAASTEAPAAAAPQPTPHPDLAASIGLTSPGVAPKVDPWAVAPEALVPTPNPEVPPSFRTTPAAIAGEHELEVARLESEGAQAAAAKAPAPTTELPPIASRPVAKDVALTATGREVPVEYAVVDARQLVPSQTQEGAPNPAYPQELQPRDRTRAASQAQISSIAQNLNPRLLDRSPVASDGAPIIAPDGTVESGNGRTLAIQRAYSEGLPGAQAYRAHLAQQGYPVENMDAPMLVRVREGTMTPEDRQAFVREANNSGQLGYSATERATTDAAAIPASALDLYRGGDVDAAANRPFVQAFFRNAVSPGEQATMIDREGRLSQEAVRRLNGALLAKAYDAPDLVSAVVESPDTNIKAIGGALTDVAGDWSQMRALARNGDIPPNLDQTDKLLAAVRLVDQARAEGRNVAEYVGQKDMFTGEALDPDTEAWLRLMFRNTRDWTNPVGREKLATALRFYAQEARKARASGNLLGLEPTGPTDILGIAKERQGGGQRDNGAAGPSLFAGADIREGGGAGAGPGLEAPAPGRSTGDETGRAQSAEGANPPLNQTLLQREEEKPAFFSALTRGVEGLNLKRAPAKDWLGAIENLKNKGVKGEEIDWSGVRDWLREQPGTVTKERVADFLRDHEVQVQEVEQGAPHEPPAIAEKRDRFQELSDKDQGQEGLSKAEHDEMDKLQDELFQQPNPWLKAKDAKYGEYTLPGGRNYRELLLTLPERARELPEGYTVKPFQNGWGVFGPMGEEAWAPTRGGALANAQPRLRMLHGESPTYRSGHWDEPNILAHVRFDDRTGPNGEKILHMAEVQSDWHQQGRRRGYQEGRPVQMPRVSPKDLTIEEGSHDWKGTAPDGKFTAKVGKGIVADEAEARRYLARYINEAKIDPYNEDVVRRHRYQVPNAPLKTSWHELAMKRMLRYAAEHGYDKLTWDTGETQAARYDLSKHIDHIELRDNETGGVGKPSMEGEFTSGRVIAYDHQGQQVIDRHVNSPEELVNLIGKDAADKILKVTPKAGRESGLGHRVRDLPKADLKVGGEGMKGFYDKILPQFLSKYAKKWGGKAGRGEIVPKFTVQRSRPHINGKYEVLQPHGLPILTSEMRTHLFDTKEAAEAFAREEAKKSATPTHSVDITPEMKKSVMEGQPLFRKEAKPFGRATKPNAAGMSKVADDIIGRLPAKPSAAEQKVLDRVAEIAREIVPRATTVAAHELRQVEPGTQRSILDKGTRVAGATAMNGSRRLIAWSLSSRDPVGTMRHEAIHWLKAEGFLTPGEWSTLERAAQTGNWLGRHGITRRYADLHPEGQIEEAIAEQFGQWRRASSAVPHIVRPIFDKISRLLGRVGDFLRKSFGSSATAEDIFHRIEAGEVGRRAVALPNGRSTKLERAQDETDIRDFGSRVKEGAAKVMDLVHDVQMLVAPMAEGGMESRAAAKDFANLMRLARYHGNRMMEGLKKDFAPFELKRMWEAADEESVARQQGKPTENVGLSRLTPRERNAVMEQQADAQAVWEAAKAQGMVQGEGLPSYVPRMMVDMAEGSAKRLGSSTDGARSIPGMGRNVRTSTPQMLHRKYLTTGETEGAASKKFETNAEVVRDLRTLPLATMRLREAVAGRALINQIKEIGRRTGEDTVVEGHHPDTPGWFTLDNPAFKTWRPKFIKDELTGKYVAATDQNGEPVFEKVPIYVRSDFEGPLRSVLTEPNSKVYNALMALKGKAMTTIMYSPLIHNAVEWGRAFPAMPGKVATLRVYFEGNRAKNDPATMTEAIRHGLVPIGSRAGGMQDITGIADADSVKAGRSWTAKILGAVPGLFNPKAKEAVYRAIDAMGDVWHNTLLWDRVGDLQMGLYTGLRDQMIRKGFAPSSAQYEAAHLANRYAGALPVEAMSGFSRKIANLMLFSRSYTLGNLGAMKDVFTGLPRDVQAQIERDAGTAELNKVKSYARRKSTVILLTDIAMFYATNSLLASAVAYLAGRQDLSTVQKGYVDRMNALMQKTNDSPLELLNPFADLQALSATNENEPGRENRVLVGYDKDGTAIYARVPTGKIGEEFTNWITSPLQTFKSKLGTLARPTYETIANDAGFGHKVYDPKGSTLQALGNIAQLYLGSQVPLDSLKSAAQLMEGKGKVIDMYKTAGPLAGVTFSKGAPGGPAVGAYYNLKERQQARLQEALPDIHTKFDGGDRAGAMRDLVAAGAAPGLARWYLKVWSDPRLRANPRAVNKLLLRATPEEREEYQRTTGAPP
jgi:hypothetical protein